MENHTAKHFVLQLGSLVSLYLSLSFLLVLIFGIINIAFPDATDSYWQIENAASGIRFGIAMVVVFFPTYLVLTRIVNKTRRQANSGSYLGLTKWLIYLSLLVGGLVILGDLVAIIMAFLEGEITQRFILKALSVLLVIGFAFYYYIKDARGYWIENEKASKLYGASTLVFVIAFLIIGFYFIETPTEAREQKLDQTQITDLQEIQWHIQDYLTVNESLPDSLKELNGVIPEAPEDRPAYTYKLTEEGFALCATFAEESTEDRYSYARPIMVSNDSEIKTIVNPDSWYHKDGEYCFERVVK